MALLSGCWGSSGAGSSGSDSGSGDVPGASFAAYGSVYRNAHYLEDGTTLLDPVPVAEVNLPITLSGVMAQSAQLSFALGGDAIRGVHYELSPGSDSPLQLSEGMVGTAIDVTLDPLGSAGTVWFREKLCSLTLTGGTDVSVEEPDEFRLFIRSTAPVPRIEFESAESSGPLGTNSLLIEQSEVSAEATVVYYTIDLDNSTAVEGVDYTIAAGSESGVLSIPAGMVSVPLDIIINEDASEGATIIVTLDHELMDRSNENLWTHTHNWDLETGDPFYASDPSDHTAWGGGLMDSAPAGTVGLDIIAQQALEPKTAPDGHVLQGLVQSMYMEGGNWYVRKGQENEFYCGGPVNLQPLAPFTRMSVYVETFLPPDDWRDSKFVKMNVRNRTKDINHVVVFQRGATEAAVLEDWNGESSWGDPVETETGWWGLWSHRELQGETWGVDFGVQEEDTVDGQKLTRIWHSHVATGTKEYDDASGNPVHEEVGLDLTEPIIRFTYFSDWDGSDAFGGDVDNRGKGLLAYWPMLETSDDLTARPPGRFWEKRNRFWEPRGNACMDPSAVIVSTFTIR